MQNRRTKNLDRRASFPPPGGQRLSQPVGEDEDASDRQSDSEQQRLEEFNFAAGKGGDQGHHHARDGEADIAHHVPEHDD
jgi:hypothetical protein